MERLTQLSSKQPNTTYPFPPRSALLALNKPFESSLPFFHPSAIRKDKVSL
ncbi:MAG: CRISPR-associated protein Cas5 [Phaeodactylibacter sp.]|nr:CRISPR-associated protein Cas5 [Phaeodactylibacter sp.]MCB9265904.1 CRISPR-associated protein Cas5 [Lewinellaceae bacterium]MCB9288680.1 CRISPR-associated protein Cas5 [Lewinellaceae bacterium]